jgi:hypothetical protein
MTVEPMEARTIILDRIREILKSFVTVSERDFSPAESFDVELDMNAELRGICHGIAEIQCLDFNSLSSFVSSVAYFR